MLIHGRLILTSNGLMLDEVRSLLQKALRRKSHDLVTRATKELLGYGKDQLPWRSLMTFLFEDHCLSDWNVLRAFHQKLVNGEKYHASELLLRCYTCRVAACLPVVALDEEYDPVHWDKAIQAPSELLGLVEKLSSRINFDLLLCHIQKAWKEGNVSQLITYMKLATMVHDMDKRSITRKGIAYLIEEIPARAKGNTGLVVLSMLYKATPVGSLRIYLYWCYKLCGAIPDAPVRLILFSVVNRLLYKDSIAIVEADRLGQIKWGEVGKLNEMPSWAVDKHTFRGKYGKGTKHLVKKKPEGMTDAMYDEFHGERPKCGVQHFFDEGCVCEKPALESNPYWERTKAIYYSKPHRLQKTVRMSAVYYRELAAKYPALLYKPPAKKSPEAGAAAGSPGPEELEQSQSTQNMCTRSRKRKVDEIKEGGWGKEKALIKKAKVCKDQETPGTGHGSGKCDGSSTSTAAEGAEKDPEALAYKGPLLQLPTGSAKVYTCLDMSTSRVWKGPYKEHKLAMVAFFHTAMKDVLGDTHTLDIDIQVPYVTFRLLKAPGVQPKTTKRDFYDCISKKQVPQGEFVLRESLGVMQLHRLGPDKVKQLPVSLWGHFLFRFALNVGDSGLYNAITDEGLSFLYGIDMEEWRKNVHGHDLLNYMFSKLPTKAMGQAILSAIREKKAELLKLVTAEINYARLDRLASEWGVDYHRARFIKRIVAARQVVAKC